MAANIAVGDRVFVNTSRIANPPPTPGAFYATSVLERADRSVRVQLPGGELSGWISTKFVHPSAGLAILQFGDFHNEAANLDPLSKGILQNARILYGDDSIVRFWKVRSRSELDHMSATNMMRFADKIIVIGHGSPEGSISLGAAEIGAGDVATVLDGSPDHPRGGWELICAVCHSGRASFAKVVSESRSVNCVIGPMHEAHSSEMSQFIQSYLNLHLLSGYTTTVAAKFANFAATGEGTFRLWRKGRRISLSYQ